MALPEFIINLFRRARYPEVMNKIDDAVEGMAATFRNADIGTLKSFRDYIPGMDSMHEWLKEYAPTMKRTVRSLIDEVHSPDVVFDRYGDVGRRIYEVASDANLEGLKWKNRMLEPFERLASKVDEEGSTRVFRALENPELATELSKPERELHDFLKNQYDFLWKSYIRHVAGSDEGYNKVMRMAMREVTEQELSELPEFLQEAYRLTKAKIRDYAPHLWKREDLVEMLQRRLTEVVAKYETATDPKTQRNLMKQIREYQDALKKLSGGDPLAFETIPKDILFRHGLLRKGALGYQEDAIRSYRSYIYSMAKKIFDEPAIQEMAALYNKLPYEIRPYAKWFIRDFAGYNAKGPLDQLAAQLSSYEYVRTLGWNLRSPIANLTQQINTFVDAGPVASLKGYIRAFTKEGNELWKKSGLSVEIPHVLTDELHPQATRVEKIKRIAGFFFNLAEEANRKHAFLTYLTKAEEKYGKGSPEAINEAIKGVYKTQFQYGRVGMPKALRTPIGRTAFQFWSYPIKQIEFLQKLAKENPLKFFEYVGLTVGANLTLERLAGIDLSNALGFGINFSEALNTFASLSKGELDEAVAHGRLTFAQGSGMLPSGFGPAMSSMISISQALMKGEGLEQIVKEITPVSWARIEELLTSIKERTAEGKVPVGKVDPLSGEMKEVLFEQPLSKMVMETFGPKSAERSKKTSEWYKQSVMEQLEAKRKRLIAEAIADGNAEKAQKMIERWNVVPTRDSIYEAVLRKQIPREFRKQWMKKEQKQAVREEQTLAYRLKKALFEEEEEE